MCHFVIDAHIYDKYFVWPFLCDNCYSAIGERSFILLHYMFSESSHLLQSPAGLHGHECFPVNVA